MGNYSQQWNMIWISGIWITTQSENTISPSNKDKMPITNMQIALEQYPGFNLPQTMRGVKWISEMVTVMVRVLM